MTPDVPIRREHSRFASRTLPERQALGKVLRISTEGDTDPVNVGAIVDGAA